MAATKAAGKSILSTFSLTESKKQTFIDKSTQRRNKLLAKLDEQILVAEAMLKADEYFGTKARIERDEDGEITRIKEPKRVNKWFYTNNGNDWYFEVKYGNRVLQLAKDKTAIDVGALDKMVAVIEQVKEAVLANELDDAITVVASKKVV